MQNYTATPPVGHMACTEPQCLYKGDLYLYEINTAYLCINKNHQNMVNPDNHIYTS
jgi:hypothetical protein